VAEVTPIGAVGRGLVAGFAGTAAMTAWQELSARLRSDGAPEEQGLQQPPEDPWASASAPAKVGRRIIEGVFHRQLPANRIGLLTNAMHWSYGTGWGAAYGLIQGTWPGGAIRSGLLFGTGVWAMSYVTMVPMGLYELPWRYSPGDLGLDLSYHLAYGAGVGAAHGLLER